jgi:hypothetical protein
MEGTLASSDTRVFDLCYPEHSSLAQVWRGAEEKSLGSGKSGKRNPPEGNKICFRQDERLADQ